MSPANCLFGRSTRDLLPGIPAKYRPHQDWLDLHERALSKKRVTGRARWDEHSQGLSPLRCGDAVMIQNQTGRHQTKWDKSGTVMEVLQYHQYTVCTDGSGRLTTRNRRYLRRYNPHSSPPSPTIHQLPHDIYTAPQPHQDADPSPPATTPTTTTIHSEQDRNLLMLRFMRSWLLWVFFFPAGVQDETLKEESQRLAS